VSAPLPPPIPAATVIVVRDSPAGLETLMLRRNPVGAFGGMWVFPGGRVDPDDHDPAAPDDEMAAARRAAVREALEEAGIAIDLARTVPFSHWTPPPLVPKRFSTWFFLAPAPDGAVTIDGGEIHDHGWLRPADALEHHARGELDLAPPTWVTLHHLAAHRDVAAVLDAMAIATIERYETWPARTADGTTLLCWHGDCAYGGGDPDAHGPRHRLDMTRHPWRYDRSVAPATPGAGY
jgi:8-oxo-dGTP pyrophosphatase MutT (NUDIX family)